VRAPVMLTLEAAAVGVDVLLPLLLLRTCRHNSDSSWGVELAGADCKRHAELQGCYHERGAVCHPSTALFRQGASTRRASDPSRQCGCCDAARQHTISKSEPAAHPEKSTLQPSKIRR
jgi:hypothetical protein